MCEHGTSTVVATPDWLWSKRAIPEKGIYIDSCIAERIATAWDHGVRTLGTCPVCGTTYEATTPQLPEATS